MIKVIIGKNCYRYQLRGKNARAEITPATYHNQHCLVLPAAGNVCNAPPPPHAPTLPLPPTATTILYRNSRTRRRTPSASPPPTHPIPSQTIILAQLPGTSGVKGEVAEAGDVRRSSGPGSISRLLAPGREAPL